MKKSIKLWLALSIVVLLAIVVPAVVLLPGCSIKDDSTSGEINNKGSVTGTVTDTADGTPLENVNVTISETSDSSSTQSRSIISDQTDENGNYLLQNVVEGNQTIVAKISGYANVTDTVTVVTDETTKKDIAMTKVSAGVVTGKVTNGTDSYALPNVQVYIDDLSDITDSSGNYTINGVPTGNAVLQAQADSSYSVYRANIVVPADETYTRNIGMQEANAPSAPDEGKGNLYGRVIDGNNSPLNKATVTVYTKAKAPNPKQTATSTPTATPTQAGTTETDANGTWSITNLTPGTYSATFTKGSESSSVSNLSVTSDDNTRVTTQTLGSSSPTSTPTSTATSTATATATTSPSVGTVLVSTRTISPEVGDSTNPDVSDDGGIVVFESLGDVVTSYNNPAGIKQVYSWNSSKGTVTRLSNNSGVAGKGGNADSLNCRVSGDGKYAVFQSTATDLVTGIGTNPGGIFLADLTAGTVKTVALKTTGASTLPDIDNTGTMVVFQSLATDLSTVTHTGGYSHIYATTIATGTPSAVFNMLDRKGTNQSNNGGANPESANARISANGQYTVFQSKADTNIMATDPTTAGNGTTYIYRNDITSDPATGWNIMVSKDGGTEPSAASVSQLPCINQTGTRVAFQSKSTNFPGTGNKEDIYVWSGAGQALKRVSVEGSGTKGDSTTPTIDNAGTYVGFASTTVGLVTGVTSGVNYIYVTDTTATGTLTYTLVSQTNSGGHPNVLCTDPEISGNGGAFVFQTAATGMTSEAYYAAGVIDVFRRVWK